MSSIGQGVKVAGERMVSITGEVTRPDADTQECHVIIVLIGTPWLHLRRVIDFSFFRPAKNNTS